jgi:aminomethyltransferase
MRYTMLTNEAGGILDDLMVTRRGDRLFLVVNAARAADDLAHIADRLTGRCSLEAHEDRALLALQGPKAATVLSRLAPASRHLMFMFTQPITIGDIPAVISRSGYTGEDGFEISLPADDAERLAQLLLDEDEVRPAGLGARDTLRLEAGLCLYGSDIDETTTPVEASLAWTISSRRREEGGFLGADVILRQLQEGTERRRVGIRPDGKAPARAGTRVCDTDGTAIGEVTSGLYGPSVEGPVAMAYVKTDFAKPGTDVTLQVRGKALAGQVVKMPFVPTRYHKS